MLDRMNQAPRTRARDHVSASGPLSNAVAAIQTVATLGLVALGAAMLPSCVRGPSPTFPTAASAATPAPLPASSHAAGAIAAAISVVPSSSAPAEPYVWKNVTIGGGGFVTGIIFNRKERGLVYARTDVGGAYRREESTGRWQPLLDWLGQPDWNLHGVESLASDPLEPNRVYVAVGTYQNPGVSNGEILRSVDYGRTWQRTLMPFKMGGNEAGRGNGERLAIDPNANHVLYFGSRKDGLFRSLDFGATWGKVESFPNMRDDSGKNQEAGLESWTREYLAQAVGIVFVLVDPRSGAPAHASTQAASRILYVAVSTAATSLFRSADGGVSFKPVPGQPLGLRPTRAALSPDGTLYVTYGDEPGPNRMRDGAVWKLDTNTRKWTNVTPEQSTPGKTLGYAAVSVDAAHPKSVVVSTWNRRPFDELFRSLDAGKSWKPVLEKAEWDHTFAPYTATMHHHWLSSVEIDPFDAGHALFTTGFGIWAARNLRDADAGQATRWSFDDSGLEETVPLALASPPEGAHLLSGVGDIDGFRHDDLAASPAARFDAPGYKNTEWLDFAQNLPAFFVRTGTTYGQDRILGAWSADGGTSWQGFAAQPPLPAGERPFNTGPIAVAADGAAIVWTTNGNPPFVSRDRGASWRQVAGAPIDIRVVADRVDAKAFYGYDTAEGTLYASSDGGLTMAPCMTGLPQVEKRRWARYADLRPVPGRRGELWLVLEQKLLHFTDNGRKVETLAAVADASAVGFGKAAEGADTVAIFLAGKIAGVDGVFRSDDGGGHWARIDDDTHRYGSITHLTGDPRIFGRVYCATGGRGIVFGDPAR